MAIFWCLISLTLHQHALTQLEGYCSYPMCVCACVRLCVHTCMRVHSNLPPLSLELQKRDLDRFIIILGSFNILPIFPKNFVQKLWCNMPTSSSSGNLALFPHEIRFLASFEAYSYIFTARTMGMWKTSYVSLVQTLQWHCYMDLECQLPFLLAHTYMQYK